MSYQESSFIVGGIKGDHCLKRIKNTLSALEGIDRVDVDEKTNQVSVAYNASQIQSEYIEQTLEALGYSVQE